MRKDIFQRTELLLGEDMMNALSRTKVIVFGVGGVGSWCAEGLVRTGIGHLTIVDTDIVCASNVNRQLMATTKTIGQVKVEALRERLLEINPDAEIRPVRKIYSEETASSFDLASYDYIIDAVDSLKHKISLILRACETDAVLFSSMGAALKVDPTRIEVANFWDVKGCPLASILRKKMRRAKTLPSHDFLCVYGDEVLHNTGDNSFGVDSDNYSSESEMNLSKAVINGTTASVTAIFGFTLSGLVIKDIYNKKGQA